MDFYEAEHRFRWLEGQRASGQLNDARYRAELSKLRVTDQWGRVWMPQERTGQWYVYHNGQWMAAQPPYPSAPPSPPPPPAPRPQQQPAQPMPRTTSQQEKSGGCGKALLLLAIWGIFWLLLAVIVFIFIGREEPLALVGVGAAALLSLVLLLASMSSAWDGVIVDLRTERVRVDDGEHDWHWENVHYAYVRRSNGKTKKLRAMSKWEIGDRLVKRRGETQIHHYPQRPAI